MINEILSIDNYYFSYTCDVTRAQQNRNVISNEPLWQQADHRFFWNMHLQEKLIDLNRQDPVRNNVFGTDFQIGRFILPIFCGFVHCSPHV
jgi:phosphatidylinositol 4-phosphatase